MKKQHWIILGSVVALLVLAVFLDLPLSTAVYDQSNWFGRIGEAFGEFPAPAIALFSSIALIVTRDKKKALSKFGSWILGGLFAVLAALMAGVLPFNYLDLSLIPGFVLAPVYVVLAVLLIKRIPKESYPRLRKAAWVGLLTFIVSMVVINLIKMGWGRLRFRAMEESTAGFTPWYLPQGLASGEEFKSFPSGHVANAALILWITLVPSFYPAWQKHASKLAIVAGAWIVLVAFSRIIMGAHFLSDVTAGFAITYLVFVLFNSVFKTAKDH